jgi:hypothetical protein
MTPEPLIHQIHDGLNRFVIAPDGMERILQGMRNGPISVNLSGTEAVEWIWRNGIVVGYTIIGEEQP